MGSQDAPNRRLAQWRDILDRASTLDNWGQMLEACNEYQKAKIHFVLSKRSLTAL
jgi:hypothetical protein